MATTTQARRITAIMHECGIPAGIRGHEYIREAITIAVDDATAVYAMTKRIYPAVAEKYDTTASRTERAIRHALESAWLTGNIAVQEKYFGYSIKPEAGKPTNSTFIATIADVIRLEQGVIA